MHHLPMKLIRLNNMCIFNIKKILLLVCVVPNYLFAFSGSLEEYMSKNPSWDSSDRASLSYITLRCSVLYKEILVIDKNIDNMQKNQEPLKIDTAHFLSISSDIYKTSCINLECINEEKKTAQKVIKKWASTYKDELSTMIEVQGEVIYSNIKDFYVCENLVKPII